MLTTLFVSQRLARSIALIFIISSVNELGRSYYQLYALVVVFAVCVPQVFLQRLNVKGLREPNSLSASYYVCGVFCILLSFWLLIFQSLPLLQFFGLVFLPFMAMEIPFFQNSYISNSIRSFYFALMIVFYIWFLVWFDGSIMQFLLIDSISRFLIVSTSLLYSWKPLVKVGQSLRLSYILNGFVGVSKFRILDVLLASSSVSSYELIYGRFLEMFYGHTSLLSNRLYAAGKKLPLYRLRNSSLVFSAFVCLSLFFEYIFSRDFFIGMGFPVIEAGIRISPLLLICFLWWLELSYFSKYRIISGRYTQSLGYHLSDLFVVVCLVFGLIYCSGLQWFALVFSIALVIACLRNKQLKSYE